jgi:hypothetical protein
MVDDILSLAKAYDVTIEQTEKEHTFFVTLRSKDTWMPPLIVQFVDKRIYSVKFINNDFFEIPDADLLKTLRCILNGKYEVKSNLFNTKKWIIIENGDKQILPERIYKLEDKKLYDRLPYPFPKMPVN